METEHQRYWIRKTNSIKNVAKTIAKVDREFAHSIDIKTKTAIELKKSLDEMKQVLQEDISIESSQ